MYRFALLLVLLTVFVHGASASVPQGAYFGGMELRGGWLTLGEGKTGEYVSRPKAMEENEFIESITVDASTYGSDTVMLVEFSKDNFGAVSSKQKIYIGDGINTYNIQRDVQERYYRVVIKGTGKLEIQNIEIERGTQKFPYLFLVGILVVSAAITAAAMYVRRKDEKY